jgi:hypothetical protein
LEEDANYTNALVESENSFIVRLKSGKSLLLLDSDYVFTGGRFLDDIHVETFISERKSINGTYLAEYAFTAENFEIGEPNILEKQIPAILKIYRPV